MIATLETAARPVGAAAGVRRWLAFAAVLAASVMDLLDGTVTSVAGPAIRRSLGGTYADLQWLGAGYTLAMAVMLLTSGRLGDMFGRRRMLLIGMAGFTAASVACAFAWSADALIAGRVLQGAFGAVMLPQGFGLLRDIFPPAQMGRAFAVFGPVMGLSAILGPILGGALVDADLLGTSWRMIFGVNVPVGLLAFAAGAAYLPSAAPAARRGLDVTGMALAAAGTFLLVFPLVQGRELGWPSWVLLMLAAAIPVLAGFALHQVRRRRSGATPLVEPSVFGKRPYLSGVVFAVIFCAAMGGTVLTLGLLLQVGLGYSPVQASLTTAPWGLGAFIGTAISGSLMARLGRLLLHCGLALMAAGLAGLYLALQLAGAGVGSLHLVAPLLVGGVGLGMIFMPLFDIILAGVAAHEVGSASSALQALQQLGMSLGIAVLGTVFFGLLGSHAAQNLDVTTPHVRAALAAAAVPAPEQERLVAGFRACLRDRETETNPDVPPASCAAADRPGSAAASGALAAAGRETHRLDAVDAAQRTDLLTIGLVALAFAFGFLLPARARPQ
jgi:EmrB/QacA subfamily drug resistance transporter